MYGILLMTSHVCVCCYTHRLGQVKTQYLIRDPIKEDYLLHQHSFRNECIL